MTEKKTWFLPPDFTFFPDGELGLGTVIEHPCKPTAVLASLLLHPPPGVVLPPVQTVSQLNHNHSASSERAFNFTMSTNLANMASGNASIDKTRLKAKSFGPVDLEVSSFNGSFSEDTIRKILEIPSVEQHVKRSSWFRRRPAYLITAISVAKDSFHVIEEFGISHSTSTGMSSTFPTGPVPLEAGVATGKTGATSQIHEYDTAPGVVVTFRCHVIQTKGQSKVQSKLFTSREAFCTETGKESFTEEQEELEVCSITGDVLNMDLDEEVDFIEEEVNGEKWIVFPPYVA